MDQWLTVLCELHKRNLLPGAPSDAAYFQGVASDAPLERGTPSGGVAHTGTYVLGHYISPGPVSDLPLNAYAPAVAGLQPKMRRMWGYILDDLGDHGAACLVSREADLESLWGRLATRAQTI